MKRFDINVNLKQAESLYFQLSMLLEHDVEPADREDCLGAFLEYQEMDKKDFMELLGAVHKAVINLSLTEEIAKRGIEKAGCTQNAEDVASVINACSDLGLLKIKNNQ